MRCSVLLKKLGHILSQRKMHLKMAFQVQKFLVCCSLTTSSLAWKVKVIYRLGNKKKEETKFTGEVKGPLLAWNGLGILKRLSTRQKRKKAKKTKVSCENSFKMRKTCQQTHTQYEIRWKWKCDFFGIVSTWWKYVIGFYFFAAGKVRRGQTMPENDALVQVVKMHPEILQQMLSTVLNIIMFEDCRNQWSMSRPLLGLILLNEDYFQSLRDQVNKSLNL